MKPLEVDEFLIARIGEDEAAIESAHPDSARLLAECKAKRRVIAHLSLSNWKILSGLERDYLVKILKIIAEPYQGHAEWREDWRVYGFVSTSD